MNFVAQIIFTAMSIRARALVGKKTSWKHAGG